MDCCVVYSRGCLLKRLSTQEVSKTMKKSVHLGGCLEIRLLKRFDYLKIRKQESFHFMSSFFTHYDPLTKSSQIF